MKIPNITLKNSNNTFLYRGHYEDLNKPLTSFNGINPIAYIQDTVTSYIDNKDVSETNIEKYGPNPVTISKPIIKYSVFYNEYNEPYISFTVENSNLPVELFYRAISQNENKLSMLSNIFNITVQQRLSDISSLLQIKNNNSWENVKSIDLTNTNIIENIIGESIKALSENEISFNNKYIENTNTCVIEIPNIWFEDNKYQIRKCKQYKIVNSINDGNNVESDILSPDILVPIDKITIERDDKIISIIRKNGIFDNKEFKTKNESVIYEDCQIDFGLNFNKIFVYDSGVTTNRMYTYRITLYDSTGDSISTTVTNEVKL